jgi:hypothetical protein
MPTADSASPISCLVIADGLLKAFHAGVREHDLRVLPRLAGDGIV